jgi:DNA repair protein RadC
MWRLPNARQWRSDDLHQRPVVGSWDKLIDYCNALIAYSKVEEFHILFLDFSIP